MINFLNSLLIYLDLIQWWIMVGMCQGKCLLEGLDSNCFECYGFFYFFIFFCTVNYPKQLKARNWNENWFVSGYPIPRLGPLRIDP